MAQEIGFYEEHPIYKEGPFVIAQSPSKLQYYFVILVEDSKSKSEAESVQLSIEKLLKSQGLRDWELEKEEAIRICDWLNNLVKTGAIWKERGCWVTHWIR